MKIFKSRLFMFILGGLVLGGTLVYASEALRAQDVLYSNSKDSNIASVKDALDKLYESNGNSSFCIKISGDKNTIGSKYECDPGDGIWRTFYILKVDENSSDLIMDSTMEGGVNYLTSADGLSLVNSWSNVSNVRRPKVVDILSAVCTIDNTYSYCSELDTIAANYATIEGDYPLPTCSEKFNTFGCESFGKNGRANILLSGSTSQGYYTDDKSEINWKRQYTVIADSVTYDYNYNQYKKFGIRPVITVSKADLK